MTKKAKMPPLFPFLALTVINGNSLSTLSFGAITETDYVPRWLVNRLSLFKSTKNLSELLKLILFTK